MQSLLSAPPSPAPTVSLPELASKVQAQWQWTSAMTSVAVGKESGLRSAVRSTREAVDSLCARVQGASARAAVVAEWAQQPAERHAAWKSFLEWRRKSPAAAIGACAVLALLPALSRPVSPRALLRNSIFGGGGACVLLYPEFVMRTAPYVTSRAEQLEARWRGSKPE